MTSLTNQNIKNLNIYSPNKHWETLCKFNKKLNRFQQSDSYIRTELLEFVDLGNGHLSQRLQRTFGLNVERVPKPFLDIDNSPKKNKIGLHFSTGPSAFDLLEKGFKEPRQLQQNTKIEIEKFINDSNYEFVEFGGKRVFDNEKVKNFTGTSIEDSIKELSECEFFIGLNSGFMSLAAAMSIKSIIIVNAPEVHNLYLPVIKDYWEEDMNWLYPQNVHLHQNGENELVKNVTQFNIEKAINGEVYPFWNLDLLDLIFK
jgi:ADP-heptose:LPS heptosyltransferase